MTKFVILSHGRTGSTALCNAMSHHPHIHAYHELLHGEQARRPPAAGRVYQDGEDAGAFCRGAVFHEPNEFGKRTIGFKMFFFHARASVAEFSAWQELIGDASIRVVLLLRKDTFDSYVSEQRSKQSGVWAIEQGQSVPQHHLQPIHIDQREAQKYMCQTVAQIEWARDAFREHRLCVTDHESLSRDFQGELNRIFDFLGEEPFDVPVAFERLNTVPHSKGIRNYDEVVRYFEHSIFRDQFIPQEEEVLDGAASSSPPR